MITRSIVSRLRPYVSSPNKVSPTISSIGNSKTFAKVKAVLVDGRKNLKKMKEMGRRQVQRMKEVMSEAFAVLNGGFSSLYDLNARDKKRSENDMMPVKLCERKEKKEKVNIKNLVLESLESRFFTMKYNE